MREEMPYLGRVTLNLIAVGEANGTLQEMFGYAAGLMAQSRKVKTDLLQAMSYPLMVLLAASGAIWFLMEKVIPKILKFLTARNVPLPTITQNLIDTVDFLEAYGGWLAGAPVALVLFIAVARRSEGFARGMDRVLLLIPFFGKILGAAAQRNVEPDTRRADAQRHQCGAGAAPYGGDAGKPLPAAAVSLD